MVVGAQVIFRASRFGKSARDLAGVFFICMFVGGCASIIPQTAQLRDNWPADVPLQAEIPGVPFFAQLEYQCGPAALATTLVHAGASVTPDELVEQVYIPARKGTVAAEMLAASRRYGMVAYQLEPSLEHVLREVAAGNPVIVLQNYGRWFTTWHYAVIVGYNSHSGMLLLRSGENPELREHIALFEYTWKDGGRWAMLALPPGRMPVTVDRARYLEAIAALERAGQPAAAASAYERFLERWPADLGASIGLANAAYATGDHARAERALRAALEKHPESPVALNNLAHVLSESGRSDEALKLIERAPTDGPYAKALSETRTQIMQRLGAERTPGL